MCTDGYAISNSKRAASGKSPTKTGLPAWTPPECLHQNGVCHILTWPVAVAAGSDHHDFRNTGVNIFSLLYRPVSRYSLESDAGQPACVRAWEEVRHVRSEGLIKQSPPRTWATKNWDGRHGGQAAPGHPRNSGQFTSDVVARWHNGYQLGFTDSTRGSRTSRGRNAPIGTTPKSVESSKQPAA